MPDQLNIIESESEPVSHCECCQSALKGYWDVNSCDQLEGDYCDDCYSNLEIKTRFECNSCNHNFTVTHHPDSEISESEYRDRGYYRICGEWLCASCYFFCEACNQYYHNDDYGDDCLCRSCYADRERENDESTLESCSDADPYQIYDYSTTPDYIHCHCENHEKANSNPAYLGIELEICFKENWETIAQIASSNIGGKYLWKYDGSIGQGAELVTEPATLQRHKKWNWKDTLIRFSAAGARSFDSKCCGLHVHISRAAFKSANGRYRDYELKLQRFFETNQVKLIKFSQRKTLEYCHIRADENAGFCARKGKVYLESKDHNRYVAVNLNNSNTIEIRLFRGTLLFERFRASLIFCDAIVSFVNSHSLMACSHGASWRYFLQFLKQSNRYNHLLKYFKNKGI